MNGASHRCLLFLFSRNPLLIATSILSVLTGCSHSGGYSGASTWGGGDANGVVVYVGMAISRDAVRLEADAHCARYGRRAEVLNCSQGACPVRCYPSDIQVAGSTERGSSHGKKYLEGTPLQFSVESSGPDKSGVVNFSVVANREIASLKFNGEEVGARDDGRYSIRKFAQVGENNFEIVAVDRPGNTQRRSISIVRAVEEVTVPIQPLNPLRISEPKPRDAIAIIIGIEKYRRVPAADFAGRDASVFYDYARRALGVKQESIKLLLDEKADAAEILRAFRNWLPTRVNKGKTDVYVFYSGHGLPSQDGNSLYFLPHEADRDLLDRTAITQSEIVEAVQRANPKSVTMFIDSCYSGQTRTGETLLASARPIVVAAKQATTFPPNFTVLSASAPDQISSSSPDLKHGIFSYYLMRGMEGEADSNNDKQITVGEMRAYLAENVTKRALGMNRTQQPQVVGDQSRVLVVR